MIEKFFPTLKVNKVEDISIEYLKQNNIAAIVFDLDSTLVDKNYSCRESIKVWIDNVKNENICVAILTNSIRKNKVKQVANYLGIPYVHFSLKPFSIGFFRIIKLIDEKKENIIMVGDQLFTDICGANMYGMKSILVNPVEKNESFCMKLKRKLEKNILKKYEEVNKC